MTQEPTLSPMEVRQALFDRGLTGRQIRRLRRARRLTIKKWTLKKRPFDKMWSINNGQWILDRRLSRREAQRQYHSIRIHSDPHYNSMLADQARKVKLQRERKEQSILETRP